MKTQPQRSRVWRTVLVALTAALAALLGFLLPSHDDLHPPQTHASLFPQALLDRSPLPNNGVFGHAPAADNASTAPFYPFGRWRAPADDVTFHSEAQGWVVDTFRTKLWHYSSFNTRDYFIGMAVVKLGYAHDAFLYVVDKTAPSSDKFEYTLRLPGSIGLDFAASSVDDSTCTRSQAPLSPEFISFCYERETDDWRIQVNATTVAASTGEARRFTADLYLKREEALALLFPLGNDSMRPAYVHKGAGSPVRGTFRFGDVAVDLSSKSGETEALGAIDWTRSLALRCTRWNWASSSFRGRVQTRAHGDDTFSAAETAAIGINLSKDVYDVNGESMENAIWINGRVFPLRGVRFTVPADPVRSAWQIASVDSVTKESVEMTFTPRGQREDHANVLIVESDFVQPYGTFSGHVQFVTESGDEMRVDVEDAFGVVEQHYAVW